MAAVTECVVRVTRNGNSRTLVIPAAIVEQAQIQSGEVFHVELVSGGILYRRIAVEPHWRFAGEGADRHVVVGAGAIGVVEADPSPRPSRDWDY